MITMLVGQTGAGKTSLLTHFADQYLNYDNDLSLAEEKIMQFNDMGYNLSMPRHLVFTDYKVSTITRFYGRQTSYFANGFYLGVPNSQHPTMFLPPYSKIFLSEAQRYYNSRDFKVFADFISQFYEQHRHWGLQIYLDCQRGGLIDLNIRDISARIILVDSITNDIDSMGRIVANRWTCREFSCIQEYDTYMSTHDKHIGNVVEHVHDNSVITFQEPIFVNTPQFAKVSNFRLLKGKNLIPSNIYDDYDSTNKEGVFLRGRKGHDFSLYEHPTYDMFVQGVDDIYTLDKPKTFNKLSGKDLENIEQGRILTI